MSRGARVAALVLAVLATGCATAPHERARTLARDGRSLEALALIDEALRRQPDDAALLRAERTRLAQTLVLQVLAQAERARAAGRQSEARALVQQAAALVPEHPRVAELERELARADAAELELRAVREALAQATREAAGRPEPGADTLRDAARRQARERLAAVLREQPQHGGARALLNQLLAQPAAAEAAAPQAGALARPVTLEFREAPLRQVFEALSRTHGLNFVFDRDVRADHRVTLALRELPLAEALRVLLVTQQLD